MMAHESYGNPQRSSLVLPTIIITVSYFAHIVQPDEPFGPGGDYHWFFLYPAAILPLVKLLAAQSGGRGDPRSFMTKVLLVLSVLCSGLGVILTNVKSDRTDCGILVILPVVAIAGSCVATVRLRNVMHGWEYGDLQDKDVTVVTVVGSLLLATASLLHFWGSSCFETLAPAAHAWVIFLLELCFVWIAMDILYTINDE